MRAAGLVVASVLMLLTLAGCTDSGATSEPDAGQNSDGRSDALRSDDQNATEGQDAGGVGVPPSEPNGTQANQSSLPTNITRFSWALEGTGSRAYAFDFDTRASNSCEDSWSISVADGRDLTYGFFRDGRGSTSGALGVHTDGSSARAADANASSGSGSSPGSSGIREYRLWMEAAGPDGDGSWAAKLTFECDAPFDVVAAKAAPVWAIFDVLEMQGTAGAAAPVGGSVADGLVVDVAVEGPATAWLWVGGASQGSWTVSTDDGSQAYDFGPTDTLHLVSGPTGDWQIGLDGATAYGSGVWGGVVGAWSDVAIA